METESNKGPWLIVLGLTVILVIGLLLNQPMAREEAIETAIELAPDGFNEVDFIQFIPMNETEFGADIWHIHLVNKDEDKAKLQINAGNGKLIEGTIEDGETGEVLEAL